MNHGGGAGPTPAQISAVSSWFSLAHPSSVITGSGYSNVHDVLNPSSPATQGTDALRPPGATSATGLPIVTVSAHVLSVPVIAARDGTTSFGFWGWFRRTGGTFPARVSARATGGASADKFDTTAFPNVADLHLLSLNGAGADSEASVTNGSVLNTFQFETYEFNNAHATDADRMVITKDAVVQTVVFAGAAFSAAMPSVTGTIMWLAQQAGGTNPFVGQCGTNWGFLGAPEAGVTAGILTPASRIVLMNYQRPT